MVRPEGLFRVRVITITAAHRKLAEILGDGLAVPAGAEAQVLQALRAVAPMVTVHSDVTVRDEAARQAGLARVDGDPRILLLLMPFHQGLKAQLRVEPLAGCGYHVPGEGGASLMLERQGEMRLVARDLKAEAAAAEALLAALPTLPLDEGRSEWMIDDPERCMNLLLELEAAKGLAAVQWPEGGRLSPPRTLGLEAMSLTVKRNGSWFDAEGELQLDQGQVASLQELLEASEQQRQPLRQAGRRPGLRPGRDLPPAPGRPARPGRGARRRPAPARPQRPGAGRPGRGARRVPRRPGLEGHAGAAAGRPGVRGRAARGLGTPSCAPTSWKATSGCGAWPARAWAPASPTTWAWARPSRPWPLLLARAGDGPALVLAPTSVCANWESEAAGLRARAEGAALRRRRPRRRAAGRRALRRLPVQLRPAAPGGRAPAGRSPGPPWCWTKARTSRTPSPSAARRSWTCRPGSAWCFPARRWRTTWPSCGTCSASSTPACWAPSSSSASASRSPSSADQDPAPMARLRRTGRALPAPAHQGPGAARSCRRAPRSCWSWSPREAEAAFLEALRRQSLEALEGGPGPDPAGAGRPHAAAPGLLQPGPGPAGPGHPLQQAGGLPGPGGRAAGERPPGPGVQPVRGPPGPAARGPGRARRRPTSTSTAPPPCASAPPPSRRSRPARATCS